MRRRTGHGGDDGDDGNVHPDPPEVCNGIDDDCDGAIDEGVTVSLSRDRDGDGDGDPGCGERQCAGTTGWVTQSGDCDDTRAAIRNGATVCDPAGRGVRTCGGGAWMAAPCPAGTSCRPQPNGTGLCI